MMFSTDEHPNSFSVKRVTLKLRAGMVGFDLEPDLTTIEPLAIPTSVIRSSTVEPNRLLALRVRDEGMEPMFFEDDWIVIDPLDVAPRSGEVYAINWNGEACVQQLVKRSGQWFLNYMNPRFGPINVRSGQLQVVGRVVYQAGRVIGGQLS